MELTKEANVDTVWLAPLHALVEQAVAAGHGDHSISALTEVLRMPQRNRSAKAGAEPGVALAH